MLKFVHICGSALGYCICLGPNPVWKHLRVIAGLGLDFVF